MYAILPVLTYLALKIPGVDGESREIIAPSEIPTGGLEPGGKGNTALQSSITLLLITVTVLSLFFLIFGGIKWITSQGDKSRLDSARKTIIYAIVGLVLAFMAFFIVNIVGTFLGVKLLGGL
jgi:hypothetical protein